MKRVVGAQFYLRITDARPDVKEIFAAREKRLEKSKRVSKRRRFASGVADGKMKKSVETDAERTNFENFKQSRRKAVDATEKNG